MVSLPAMPPWAIPLAGGLLLGWFFSGTISKGLSFLPVKGGHVAYSYPGAAHTSKPVHGPSHALTPSASWPRRSFDREYSSWLETTVNSVPTIG